MRRRPKAVALQAGCSGGRWTRVSVRWRRRLSALVLVLGALWLWVNKPAEEQTLLAWGRSHGVTVADLLFVLAVIVFGWLLLRRT